MAGWIRKAIGTPSQASRVVKDARKDVAKKPKDQVAEQRQKKQGGGK